MNSKARIAGLAAGCAVIAGALTLPAQAHHSFAMYNLDKTMVMTGVVTRVDPAPNHLQIFFAQMNEERTNVVRDANNQPIIWSVEMGGSAQMARQGVTVNSFAPRTVFSVGFHPLRNGEHGGSREGGMFRCPDETPPEPGKHCDSVEGNTQIGNEPLPSIVE